MVKKEVKKFDISWRLYSLILLTFFTLIITGVTIAYGTSNPVNMGHSAGELHVDVDGTTKTLQEAIDDNFATFADLTWSNLNGIPAGFDDDIDNAGTGGIIAEADSIALAAIKNLAVCIECAEGSNGGDDGHVQCTTFNEWASDSWAAGEDKTDLESCRIMIGYADHIQNTIHPSADVFD